MADEKRDAKTLAISANRLAYRALNAVGLNPVKHDDHVAARVELLAEALRELADAVEQLAQSGDTDDHSAPLT